MATLQNEVGTGQGVVIRSNAELKAAALEVFERSFAVTSVVRALAVAVAFVGVLGALMAIQLERAVEFGTLRVIGFTPGTGLANVHVSDWFDGPCGWPHVYSAWD